MNNFSRLRQVVASLSTLLAIVVSTENNAISAALPVVHAPAGTISGTIRDSVDLFYGIPFAYPPPIQTRWLPSTPLKALNKPLHATSEHAGCAAPASLDAPELLNEDCLYLNIYRPAGEKTGSKLPVIVFFHGGGNQNGSPTIYEGRAFAARTHSIVVMPTYRLGVFGFLALNGVSSARVRPMGNAALSDMLSALNWVHTNIPAFGGDASTITVVGESAGAANLCDILITPSSKGLFSRMILQSGFCSQRPSLKEMEAIGAATARNAGCTEATPLACLSQLPTKTLLNAWDKTWQQANIQLADGTQIARPLFPATPIGSPLQPYSFKEAVETGKFTPIPILIGFNKDELRSFLSGYYPLSSRRYIEILKRNYPGYTTQLMAEYPLQAGQDPTYTLAALRSDQMLICPALQTAALLSGKLSVSVYEFADRTAPAFRSLAGTLPPAIGFDRGASHTSELQYLFGYKAVSGSLSPSQQKLSAQMMAMWGSFGRKDSSWPTWFPSKPVVTTLALPEAGGIRVELNTAQQHHCNFWDEHRSLPNNIFP